MDVQCSQCDKPNPADSTFCGFCGAPLAPEGIPAEATTTELLQSRPSAESEVPQEAAPEASPGARREPTPETVRPQVSEPPRAQDDLTYYEDEEVAISPGVAILGDRTYSLSDVASVSLEYKPASRMPSLLLAAFGALVAVTALADVWGDPVMGIVVTACGLALLGLGTLLAATAQPRYIVRVNTAAGEEDALVSPNQERVERIAQAIRKALDEQA